MGPWELGPGPLGPGSLHPGLLALAIGPWALAPLRPWALQRPWALGHWALGHWALDPWDRNLFLLVHSFFIYLTIETDFGHKDRNPFQLVHSFFIYFTIETDFGHNDRNLFNWSLCNTMLNISLGVPKLTLFVQAISLVLGCPTSSVKIPLEQALVFGVPWGDWVPGRGAGFWGGPETPSLPAT